MFNSQSNTPLSDAQFDCLLTAFKNDLTPGERASLEAARVAWMLHFTPAEEDMAERLFWTSVPGFKSFEAEWRLWPAYRKYSNCGVDTPRSCWEKRSYELHTGKAGVA